PLTLHLVDVTKYLKTNNLKVKNLVWLIVQGDNTHHAREGLLTVILGSKAHCTCSKEAWSNQQVGLRCEDLPASIDFQCVTISSRP
ncbi:hypothetical protein ACQP3J_32645, partial [Escherichia coli]